MEVRERLSYDFTWTVPEPQNWHDLRSLELRISDGTDTIFWVRFDEATNSFSLVNEAAAGFAKGLPPGSHASLQTREATLDLADTRVVGTGPTGQTVTLKLALSFKPLAAGRTFMVDVRATDDHGTEDPFTHAGTLIVSQ